MLEPDAGSKDVVESETGSYIVVMDEDPVVVTVGQDDLDTPAAEHLADDLEAEQDDVLEDIGGVPADKVNTYTNALNGFSAFLSYDEAQTLAANPKVAVVLPDELHQATTNDSGDYLGLAGRGGAYDSGLTGEDVVVGVIDTGIWPEHPSFADDGSYGPHPGPTARRLTPELRVRQHGPQPDDVAFTCNNKLLGARQMLDTYRAVIGADPDEYDSARDDDGHGTHTASTAAGNAGVEASMYGEDLGRDLRHRPARPDHRLQGSRRARRLHLRPRGRDRSGRLRRRRRHQLLDRRRCQPPGRRRRHRLPVRRRRRRVRGDLGRQQRSRRRHGRFAGQRPVADHGRRQHPEARSTEGEVKTKGGPKVKGASLTPELGRTDFVDAEDFGNELCLPDVFAPGSLTGKIVLCRRGAIGRAAKGAERRSMPAASAWCCYNFDDNDNLFTDTHVIPAVHINYTDGLKLKNVHRQAGGQGQECRGRDPQDRQGDHGQGRAVDGVLLVARPERSGARHHQARHHRPRPSDPGRRLAGRERLRRFVPGDLGHVDVEPARGGSVRTAQAGASGLERRRWRSRRS